MHTLVGEISYPSIDAPRRPAVSQYKGQKASVCFGEFLQRFYELDVIPKGHGFCYIPLEETGTL